MNSHSLARLFLTGSLLAPVLMLGHAASAQGVFPSHPPHREFTLGDPVRRPHASALDTFRRSPLFAQRQRAFRQAWTSPTADYRYADGHSLHFVMVKNPSLADGETHVTKNSAPVGATTPCAYNAGWDCTTSNITLTAQSTSFKENDYANANSHIYPGAIFTFNSFYHGQYREQAGARNPMTLVTDNPNINGSASVMVQNPGIATCRDGVAEIYRRFTRDVGTESSYYDVMESNNSADLNIQISGGASSMGLSFSDAFSHQSSSNTVSLTVDAAKSLYSISALPPDSGFFQNAAVENTPNLMVVSNVVYGARVLANVSVTFNTDKDANDFKAAYSGFGFDANAAFNYVQSHQSAVSAIHAYIVGGPGSSQVSFSKDGLEQQINRILGGVTYQNARPISYQFMDMAGDIVGAQSATDRFQVQTCAPSNKPPAIKTVRVHFQDGSDGKDNDTDLNVYLYPGDTQTNMNNEKQGSILGYESQGHSWKFPNNGAADIYLSGYTGPNGPAGIPILLDRNTFIRSGGGHLHLNCYRHGNDDWIVQKMDVIINFADGTSKDIAFPPFTTRKGEGPIDFYFDAAYNVRT